jgi:hypothetical protein
MQKALFIVTAILIANTTFAFASGGTHEVQSYYRGDGTYVEEHLSGNPGSGIHCHDNVCE